MTSKDFSPRIRKITLADVARAAGVSSKTVSRVINNDGYVSAEVRQQIEHAIKDLGYRPNRMARSLASSRSFIIGLTIPDVTNPFFPEIIRGAEQVGLEHGYNVLVHNTDLEPTRERNGLALLEEMCVDGVIVCSMRLPDDELSAVLRRFPASVLINRLLPGSSAGVVRVDYFNGMQRMVQHVLASGRRRIGYLDVIRGAFSYSSHERFRGFEAAMRAVGLDVDPDFVRRCFATIENSRQAAYALLNEQPDLDAIICYNDIIAGGALEACAQLGVSVPDQVAITGFDDIMFSSVFKVALTTMRVPKFELGARAMQMLCEHIEGHFADSELVLDTDLIVRQSTPPVREKEG